jgi:hypothetical protein
MPRTVDFPRELDFFVLTFTLRFRNPFISFPHSLKEKWRPAQEQSLGLDRFWIVQMNLGNHAANRGR